MRQRPIDLKRTLGPLVVAWIEANLVHGPGDVQGQRIQLDDDQVRLLLACYELDDRGRRVVRRAVYSRPKGRAKSEIAAMVVCAEALGPVRFAGWDHDGRPLGRPVQTPIIPCVATEEGQADNTFLAAHFMLTEGAVSPTEGLDAGLTRIFLPGGGWIRPFSARASSKDGGKETFCNFDEPHLYVSAELKSLHATIRRNLAKRKASEPWSLETTTMYAPGEESIAELAHRYAIAIAEGRVTDPGFLFDHREGPADFDWDDDDQLRAALATAYGEAAEWMDLERLIAEARDPENDRSDFTRYFLNRACARQEGRFIADEAWAALADPESAIPDGAHVALGLDGSRTFDTTAVGWAARAGDGRVDVGAHVFSVRRTAPHHTLHEGGRIVFDDVEEFVIDRFDEWRVDQAAYDPTYLDRSADILEGRLPESRIAAVEPSSKLMRQALTAFERGVSDGLIRHRGDPVVAAHVRAAGVQRGESKEIRRVFKLDRSKPIDAVISMALAYWRATHAPAPPRPFVLVSR